MREMLKTPFRKLRNFALSKQGSSKKSPPQIGESLHVDVTKWMQDAEEMREKFEGFLTNGHVISGSAYDFSRSVQDMASYMMESFGEIVDGEIGNIFNLLAKVQFEISKLLDLFAAHVSETIIKPTEDMMTRIQEAMIMKNQFDENRKRNVILQLEKQKRKRGKGSQANQQSVLANEELREQTNAFNISLQSLMQRQLESLVTQAVKYHSAQVHLFSKALASLNAMEPMMKQIASEKGIDRSFSEEEVSTTSYLRTEMDGEGEVATFDSITDSMASSLSRHLVEQTQEPPRFSSDSSEEFPPGGKTSVISKSEPISPLMHHRREGTAKGSSVDSEQERVRMYALPSPVIPVDGKWVENSMRTRRDPQKYSGARISPAYYSGSILEAHHPSGREGFNNAVRDILLSRLVEDQQHQVSKGTSKKPDFFVEDAKDDDSNGPSTDKTKRYSQSGPLRDSGWASKKGQCPYLGISSINENPSLLYKSGPISRSPICSYTVGDISLPPSSAPQISELHKLPPPPIGTPTPPKSPSHTPTAFSALPGDTVPPALNQAGSALPSPPASSLPRSLSIPASTTHGPDMTDS